MLSPQDALKYHVKHLPKTDEFGDKIGVTDRDKKILMEYLQNGTENRKMDKNLVALRKAVMEYQKEHGDKVDKDAKTPTKGQKGEPSKKTDNTDKTASAKSKSADNKSSGKDVYKHIYGPQGSGDPKRDAASNMASSIRESSAAKNALSSSDASTFEQFKRTKAYKDLSPAAKEWAHYYKDGGWLKNASSERKSVTPITKGKTPKKHEVAGVTTDIKSLQSKGWQVHGREFPSLRSKKAPVAYLVSPDGKKMYTLSAGMNPKGKAIWTLSKKAELQDTPASIRKKFEK